MSAWFPKSYLWVALLGFWLPWTVQGDPQNAAVQPVSDCQQAQTRLTSQLSAVRTALQEKIEDLKAERDDLNDQLKVVSLNLDQSHHLVEDLVKSLVDCRKGNLGDFPTQQAEDGCQKQLSALADRFARMEIQNKRLRAQVKAREEEIAQLQKKTEEMEALRAQLENLESELADQIQTAATEKQSLELQIASEHAERDNLQSALNESEWELEGVKQKLLDTQRALKIARARLPLYAGGSGLNEHLRQQAADWFQKLRALYEQPHPKLSLAEWREERQRLQEGVAKWQESLAETLGMSVLYQVQSGDSLEKISQRFYGTPKHWQRIYGANRHLIDDPQRPLPGITLIIPTLTPIP